MSAEITYKTHILIGVRENGVMTVIADWPHVPKQSEVQARINDTRNGYVWFMLCTPTGAAWCAASPASQTPPLPKLRARRRANWPSVDQ